MRALVVAASSTPPHTFEEIREGRRPRLDYYELSERLGAPFVDESPPWTTYPAFVRSFEKQLRFDFYWASKIAKRVREDGYDLVITLSERMGMPLAHLLDKSVRHVTLSHKPLAPLKLQLIKTFRTFRHWDILLTFSQAEAEAMRKTLELSADRVRGIHWGVDTRFYAPASVPLAEGEPEHIFSIGVSNRDYPTLIEAMRRLPHVRLHISATSAWEGSLAEYGKLPDNVRMVSLDHPFVIREAYAKCRFVVIPMQPSLQWSAGCTSVLQPQAMGKPVIATRRPGLSEYLVDGKTGLLVNVQDPDAMAQAIDELWKDRAKADAMGRQACAWVTAQRSLDRSLDELVSMAYEVEVCAA